MARKSHDRVVVEEAVRLFKEVYSKIVSNPYDQDQVIYGWALSEEDSIAEVILGLENLLERKSKPFNGDFL
jgi:endo-1,4-beta-mannosidase